MAKHIGVVPRASPTSLEHHETPACATRAFIEAEGDYLPDRIWEPCAGKGAISRLLMGSGREVVASDLAAYPGRDKGIAGGVDFLLTRAPPPGFRCIVTNFPYAENDACIEHALNLGCDVTCLMRWAWPEGKDGAIRGSGIRSTLVDHHLTHAWLGIERLPMMHREGYEGKKLTQGAVPYAWFCFSPARHPARTGFRVRRISWRE